MSPTPLRDLRPEGAELGPGCLLWRYAGDWRSMLPGAATGLLQLMLPALGQGVVEHSKFFSEPFDRVYRSIPQIWATIFEPDGERRGRVIRDLHGSVKGVDPSGQRYHALDPETFWWAHATFTWNIFRSVELFYGHQLTESQLEQLYAQTVTWYRRYGVSERPVPADYQGFQEKFHSICREKLELTPAATRALEIGEHEPPALPFVPSRLSSALGTITLPLAKVLVFGCLPEEVRTRFDIPWSRIDAVELEVMRRAVRQGFALVPGPIHARSFRDVQRFIGARTRERRLQGAEVA
jgi:uncharacterized protein (DUF2236 family)